MFVLHEIDIDVSNKHLESSFNPICHAIVKVFGEDTGEGGVEFRDIGPAAIEFQDTAAEIVREREIDKCDLVFEVRHIFDAVYGIGI